MKVLVINPIMYTSETKNIKRALSIKDTMMYDLCLAFHEMGHSVRWLEESRSSRQKVKHIHLRYCGGSASVKKSACLTVFRLCRKRIDM